MRLARHSDAATSHEAATVLPNRVAAQWMADAISRLAADGNPPTANEAAVLAKLLSNGRFRHETLRKRIAELVREQVVVGAGMRRCSVTGFRAQTYRVP